MVLNATADTQPIESGADQEAWIADLARKQQEAEQAPAGLDDGKGEAV